MQTDTTVFKLVERRVIRFVHSQQLAFESLEFVFSLRRAAQQGSQFNFDLLQVGCSALDVLLSLEQTDFLFFIVGFDSFCQSVFTVFEHFYKHLKFLLELAQCAFSLTAKLLFDLL